jgi:DNA-binding PadR family transcriptional regulator
LDNLEKRGLVERKAHAHDRRLYSIHLTKNGDEILEKIGKVAREHQDALLTALDKEERDALASLLLKIADQQGLVRGVYPGYQVLGSSKQIDDGPARQMRRP